MTGVSVGNPRLEINPDSGSAGTSNRMVVEVAGQDDLVAVQVPVTVMVKRAAAGERTRYAREFIDAALQIALEGMPETVAEHIADAKVL